MASTLSTSLYTSAMTLYTLGIYRVYYFKKRFRSQANPDARSDQDIYFEMLASYHLWGDTLSEMNAAWRAARDVCILLLSISVIQFDAGENRLSVAILQIDVVAGTIFARTSAISAFLFATMGLVLSHLYTSKKLDLNSRSIIDKWVKASMSIDTVTSVEFWACLVLPFSCTIWSVFYPVFIYSSNIEDRKGRVYFLWQH
ncbi:hypothetical protein CVT25_012405 [Psilocybe cyanescens]|uniref:Uncharacterized protein n=1 Tax=Psilocybe cyanescens TaxID=93625 RepID=A0A409X7P3_PSICY|nr:hypothetical protein CVT25_012405 [Psilocybe cyanescens]